MREFHYKGKNYPSPLLVTSIQGDIEGRPTFPPWPHESVCLSPSTEPGDYTVPRQVDLHLTIQPRGTSSSMSLLT